MNPAIHANPKLACAYTMPKDADTLRIVDVRNHGKEIIRIAKDGHIFWHEREVETDDDFRSAMMELAQQLVTQMRPQ